MLRRIAQSRVVGIGRAVMERFARDGGNNMAAAVAYYGFLTVFPLMLLALALIGFILAGDIEGQQEWVDRLSDAVPGLSQIIGENVRAVVEGRGAVGVVGLAVLAWTGAGIVMAAGTALNRIFRVYRYESFVKRKAWQFGTLAGLGVLALTAVAVTALVRAIELSGALGFVLRAGALLLGFGLDFLLFMLSYRLLTQRGGPPFGKLWVGALFATIGWTVLKLAGSWYAARVVGGATAVYGTFAAVVGVLVVMHLGARLLLYGAEINAVLIEEKGGGPVGEWDRREVRREGLAGETGDGHRNPGERSTPELLMAIASDTSSLVRKEMELARQEVAESITSRVKSFAVLGAGGVMGLFALGWLSASLAAGLDVVLEPWASRLVVAGIFLLLAAIVFVLGRAKPKPPLAETKRTIKEDVRWAKLQLKR